MIYVRFHWYFVTINEMSICIVISGNEGDFCVYMVVMFRLLSTHLYPHHMVSKGDGGMFGLRYYS